MLFSKSGSLYDVSRLHPKSQRWHRDTQKKSREIWENQGDAGVSCEQLSAPCPIAQKTPKIVTDVCVYAVSRNGLERRRVMGSIPITSHNSVNNVDPHRSTSTPYFPKSSTGNGQKYCKNPFSTRKHSPEAGTRWHQATRKQEPRTRRYEPRAASIDSYYRDPAPLPARHLHCFAPLPR